MRFITPVVYAGLLAASIYTALAQSSPVQLASATTDEVQTEVAAPPSLAEQSAVIKPPARHAVRVGRREVCRQQVAAKHLKRREARDQVQICVAQARVECLRQAIDARVRGITQRRLYVKACVAS
ncbi:MAG: hypothetical protein K2W78_10940 [Xanthobacteraceae bacterium]|nr:hypothetical protein [Xanthobacteraceae bacterium]